MRYKYFFISFLFPCFCWGQTYFEWSEPVERCYSTILDLKLDQAQSQINQVRLTEKDNLCLELLESYIDFLAVFISEREDDLELFKEGKSRRLKRIKEGEIDDPFYLFSQAQIHLQSALVRLKFKEYFGAFNDVSQAYNHLEYNLRSYPDFLPTKVSLGMMKAMIGTIPDSYQWGVRLLGMDGDLMEGLNDMLEVVRSDRSDVFWLRTEAQVMCALGLLHLAKDSDGAWEMVEQMKWDAQTSLLAAFVKANVAGRTGRNDVVVDILESRPKGTEYEQFWYLEYLLGEAKLRRLDPSAKDNLLRFVENFRGKNYIKDAYRKLAWYDLIFNEGQRYSSYVEICRKNGGTQIDSDKSALRWAENGQRPHNELLQARLLYDGGYFQLALSILEDVDKVALEPDHLLEWYYRVARCYQGLSQMERAIEYYNLVLSSTSTNYMVANSALQLGLIYEQSGDLNKAYHYYTMCRELKSDEYEASLNQKAKAGLERVK